MLNFLYDLLLLIIHIVYKNNRMKRSIILSLLPLCDYVPKTEANCFEIYGFDFLLDENLRPWMLEVNFSPSLGCECNVDQSVKEV